MKKCSRIYLRWVFLVPFTLLFVLGCQKELMPAVEKNATTNLTIEEAKTFFDKNVSLGNPYTQKKEESIENLNIKELLNHKRLNGVKLTKRLFQMGRKQLGYLLQ